MSHTPVLLIGFGTVAAAAVLLFAAPQAPAQDAVVVPTPAQAPLVLQQDAHTTTVAQPGVDGKATVAVIPLEGPVWHLVLTDRDEYAAIAPFGMERQACIQARDTYRHGASCLHKITGEVLP